VPEEAIQIAVMLSLTGLVMGVRGLWNLVLARRRAQRLRF